MNPLNSSERQLRDAVALVARVWGLQAGRLPQGAWPSHNADVLEKIGETIRSGDIYQARHWTEHWKRAWMAWLARGGKDGQKEG